MTQGEVIAGRFDLVELIGKGGMSSVYKAHDRLLDRVVAIKILHPHYTQDEEYVERMSLRTDLAILRRTLAVLVGPKRQRLPLARFEPDRAGTAAVQPLRQGP